MSRTPSVCPVPGCPRLVTTSSPCPTHPPRDRRSPSSKVTGTRRWREQIRPAVLRRDKGVCHICGRPGADEVDHLDPASTHPDRALSMDLTCYAAAHAACNNRRGNRSTRPSP